MLTLCWNTPKSTKMLLIKHSSNYIFVQSFVLRSKNPSTRHQTICIYSCHYFNGNILNQILKRAISMWCESIQFVNDSQLVIGFIWILYSHQICLNQHIGVCIGTCLFQWFYSNSVLKPLYWISSENWIVDWNRFSIRVDW